MFTIVAVAAACSCSIIFGTVDWTKSYSGQHFQVGYYRAVLDDMNKIDRRFSPEVPESTQRAARRELRKIIGDKTVLCFGSGKNNRKVIGKCYINGPGINEDLDVAEEMHKRGF